MGCFASAVAISLLTRNGLIGFVLFSGLFLFDRRLLISVLVVTPLIETVLIAQTGLTATKLIAAFLSAWFSVELLVQNRFQIDKRLLPIFVFMIVSIAGLSNALITGDFFISVYWEGALLGHFLKSDLPKLIFVVLLYLYIKSKGISFLLENLRVSTVSISSILLIIAIYFRSVGFETSTWWNVATRLSFTGADPNEFAGIFVALGVFPLTLYLFARSRMLRGVALMGFLAVVYSVFLTLSRGGFLTLLFMLVVFLFAHYKHAKKRLRPFLFMVSALMIGLYASGLLDLGPLYERFFGVHVRDLSSVTAGRADWLRAGLNAALERPLFGYGGTQFASKWINYQAYGRRAVMHNLYMEILVQYGIAGILAFAAIIFASIRGFFVLRRKDFVNRESLLLYIPFISLAALLFSALALSWQWREIVWYFVSISLVTSTLVRPNGSSRLQ